MPVPDVGVSVSVSESMSVGVSVSVSVGVSVSVSVSVRVSVSGCRCQPFLRLHQGAGFRIQGCENRLWGAGCGVYAVGLSVGCRV